MRRTGKPALGLDEAKARKLLASLPTTGTMQFAMSHDAERERHALMPLDLAAEVIRQKVYPDAVARSLTREQLLDSIAATISVVATIYEYDLKDATAPRPLSRMELDGGMFKGGAKELRFIDGRPTRSTLAVTAQDIAETIEALKGATA